MTSSLNLAFPGARDFRSFHDKKTEKCLCLSCPHTEHPCPRDTCPLAQWLEGRISCSGNQGMPRIFSRHIVVGCLYSSKEASAKGKIWRRERHVACDSARGVFSDALDAAPFHGLNTVPSWSRTTRMMTWFWPRCVGGKRLLLSLLNAHGALARFPMHASFGSRKKRTLVACAWAPVSFLWNP